MTRTVRGKGQAGSRTGDVDARIGERVRLLREERGLSRVSLARSLGLPQARLERYESGKSRIAASTLFELAQTFHVPPSFFLDPLPAGACSDDTDREEEVIAFMKTPECVELIHAVRSIGRPRVRRQVMTFLRGITGVEEDE